MITTDHLPIWIAEEKDLTSKLTDRRMAPTHGPNLRVSYASSNTSP